MRECPHRDSIYNVFVCTAAGRGGNGFVLMHILGDNALIMLP